MSKFKKVMGIVGKVLMYVVAVVVGVFALAGVAWGIAVSSEAQKTGRSIQEVALRHTKYL